ncbi:conserved hypothetical protein [Arthrobacter sp. 9AX]|uniref:hypothetical protein n=1 Tax=Arthrobacter sp. 9AX TaxID=2653131 RepID=UPI0012F22580|nr:hypothetical protein [Arthrobacter sp. 9AX]VXC19300.1 conserved hypothetical protein [Arthrobacter sp. 9AX]
MTFFRDFPVPELPPRPRTPKPIRPEWSGAPDDELPAVVHLGQFLYRSSNRVLAIRSAQIYSTGCTLDVAWFIRRADESDQDWAALNAAFFSHGHDPRHAASGTGLLFGVEFSDGSRASTAVMHMPVGPHDPAYQPTSPVLYLQNRGGGGGDDELSGSGFLWLWPLPSAGDLRLVAQWTDMGMSEGSIMLDGKRLRETAAGAEKYWPEAGGQR